MLMAANVSKKIIRHRDKVSGNIKTEDQDVEDLKQRLASEIADVIVYADLCIQALGMDTSDVLRRAWNKKSEDIGYQGGNLPEE